MHGMFKQRLSELSGTSLDEAKALDILQFLQDRSMEPFLYLALQYKTGKPSIKSILNQRCQKRYFDYIDEMAWNDTKERKTKSGKQKSAKVVWRERMLDSLNVLKMLSFGRGQTYKSKIDDVIKNENHLFEEFLNISRLNLVSSALLICSRTFMDNLLHIEEDYKDIFFPMRHTAASYIQSVKQDAELIKYISDNFGINL